MSEASDVRGKDGLPSLKNNTADRFLQLLTEDQLIAGISKATSELHLLDQLLESEDYFPNGPFIASKSYEVWMHRDDHERRRLLNIAKTDLETELHRRSYTNEAISKATTGLRASGREG